VLDGPAGGGFSSSSSATSLFTGPAGQYTLRLAVTDSAGTIDSYDFVLALSPASGGSTGGGGGGALSLLHLALLAGLLAGRRRIKA
jgi:hypothetical protein